MHTRPYPPPLSLLTSHPSPFPGSLCPSHSSFRAVPPNAPGRTHRRALALAAPASHHLRVLLTLRLPSRMPGPRDRGFLSALLTAIAGDFAQQLTGSARAYE